MPSPTTRSTHRAAPFLIVGRWAWYCLPVAALSAALAFWSVSRAPSEEGTRFLHEQHPAEWQYIRHITGQ